MGCGASTNRKAGPSGTHIQKLHIKLEKLIGQIEYLENMAEEKKGIEELGSRPSLNIGHLTMTKTYKVRTIISEIKSERATPNTGTPEPIQNTSMRVKTTLDKEEMACRGKEEQLISNFKFCFDLQSGKAIGFQEKK